MIQVIGILLVATLAVFGFKVAFIETLLVGSIVAGATLLHLGGLGLIPLAFGAWRHSLLVKKYREEVLADYPQLAPPAT